MVYSNRKVGGIRFLRLGWLQISVCWSDPEPRFCGKYTDTVPCIATDNPCRKCVKAWDYYEAKHRARVESANQTPAFDTGLALAILASLMLMACTGVV